MSLTISLVQTLDKKYLEKVNLDDIVINPNIPSKNAEIKRSIEVAEDIQKYGQKLPILCEKSKEGTPVLFLGDLYYKALKLSTSEEVWITYIHELSVELIHLITMSFVDAKLTTFLEEVRTMEFLSKELGVPHSQLATRFRISRSTVSNRIRMLALPYEVMNALVNDEITEGHARAILSLKSKELMINAVEIVKKDKLSVRQTEELSRNLLGRIKKERAYNKIPDELTEMAAELENKLQTNVNIQPMLKGGRIMIAYKSRDDLKRILSRFGII